MMVRVVVTRCVAAAQNRAARRAGWRGLWELSFSHLSCIPAFFPPYDSLSLVSRAAGNPSAPKLVFKLYRAACTASTSLLQEVRDGAPHAGLPPRDAPGKCSPTAARAFRLRAGTRSIRMSRMCRGKRSAVLLLTPAPVSWLPPSPSRRVLPPAAYGVLQVGDDTRVEFAKGIAEAMKRKLDQKVDKAEWEQRLEAAAAAAAAGGNEVSRCMQRWSSCPACPAMDATVGLLGLPAGGPGVRTSVRPWQPNMCAPC